MENNHVPRENEDKPLTMHDFVKTVKVPFTDRMVQAATYLFGQSFAAMAMILVAPFAALRILFKNEMLVPDFSKIPVHYVNGQPMIGGQQAGMTMPSEEEIKRVNKTVIDMFDTREPWQREHDDLYGEGGDDSTKD